MVPAHTLPVIWIETGNDTECTLFTYMQIRYFTVYCLEIGRDIVESDSFRNRQ